MICYSGRLVVDFDSVGGFGCGDLVIDFVRISEWDV